MRVLNVGHKVITTVASQGHSDSHPSMLGVVGEGLEYKVVVGGVCKGWWTEMVHDRRFLNVGHKVIATVARQG
ncbi:hypothetical protein J6590_041688 [Homalodisca vitripennis]|nr:hypothetical protein J6590_041688 [Homalodisca vitripennis]